MNVDTLNIERLYSETSCPIWASSDQVKSRAPVAQAVFPLFLLSPNTMLTDHSNPDIQLLSPSLTPSTGPSSQVQNDPPDFASAGAQDTSEPSLRKTYTRPQLLALHNSPLVQMPPNMPDLKDWFGYLPLKIFMHWFWLMSRPKD